MNVPSFPFVFFGFVAQHFYSLFLVREGKKRVKKQIQRYWECRHTETRDKESVYLQTLPDDKNTVNV